MRQHACDHRRKRYRLGLLVLSFLALAAGTGTASAADRPGLEYNRDVRPILAENCFPCHGPDSAARKADLRLDRRDAAIEAGAIAPGDTEVSELIARINAKDPKELMPPAVDHQDADPEAERRAAALDRRGRRVSTALVAHPPQAARAAGRCKTRRGSATRSTASCWRSSRRTACSPAPEADRRTLARRLSLDLTGLPPDPADRRGVRQRLRARRLREAGDPACSTRPGGASIAPATGSTPPATPTPTAITSTTSAKPGPIATGSSAPSTATCRSTGSPIEQLAGDLLPGSTLDQQVASGFNRCNMTTNEGGVDPRGIPGALHPRPHRDRLAGLAGADGRLRGLPRPQVRPDQPARVLRAVGVLQQHDAADHGRQRQGHAADRLRAEPRPIGRAGRLCPAELRRRPETARRSQAVGPVRFHEMAGRGRSQGT